MTDDKEVDVERQAHAGRRIFFSVGEPSGDLHGANLIAALRRCDPTVECRVMGGPKMEAAGMAVVEDLTRLAVMGIVQVVLRVHLFWKALRRVDAELGRWRPDLVVLIDFPGFNWWVARAARRHGIPVVYYGVPQLWAWGSWRVGKMRRLVDLVLSKLPFEAEWYRGHGVDARYVGHPYFDELATRGLDRGAVETERDAPHLVLLPGSRRQEVEWNLAAMLSTAERVRAAHPDLRVTIASFNEPQAHRARQIAAAFDLPVEVEVGRATELIADATICLACSGSVSLELLYFARPAVIYYRVRPTMWFVARRFLLTVRYITLVNLLACDDRFDTQRGPYDASTSDRARVPYPEYPVYWDATREMAAHLQEWLDDPGIYRAKVKQLEAVRDRIVRPGATQRAAEAMMEMLSQRLSANRAA